MTRHLSGLLLLSALLLAPAHAEPRRPPVPSDQHLGRFLEFEDRSAR